MPRGKDCRETIFGRLLPAQLPSPLKEEKMGECQSIAHKGVHAIDARNSQLEMAQVLQKRVFAFPGLSTRERKFSHKFF